MTGNILEGSHSESKRILDTILTTIVELIDFKEHNVINHAKRSGLYAQIIAETLVSKGYYIDEIDADFISKLNYAAPLHDIGKLYTPDYILNKPGKLSDEEFEIMKLHTIDGERIIDGLISNRIDDKEFINLLSFAKEIALYHHEKWNGTGYPCGLSKYNIPLSARILAIADVFDALTSDRVYRNALDAKEALKIIYGGSGTHFEPIIVKAFISSFDKINNLVEINGKIK